MPVIKPMAKKMPDPEHQKRVTKRAEATSKTYWERKKLVDEELTKYLAYEEEQEKQEQAEVNEDDSVYEWANWKDSF